MELQSESEDEKENGQKLKSITEEKVKPSNESGFFPKMAQLDESLHIRVEFPVLLTDAECDGAKKM